MTLEKQVVVPMPGIIFSVNSQRQILDPGNIRPLLHQCYIQLISELEEKQVNPLKPIKDPHKKLKLLASNSMDQSFFSSKNPL